MDTDIDISRSLDIIAEEMSGKESKTNLPFIIEYQKEDNQDISDSTSVTLRQALRQWAEIQDFNKRLFSIARCLIKYGDCFFQKTSDTKKWKYVDPSLVHGIEINELGDKISYHVKKANTGVQNPYSPKNEELQIIPAAAMIHITMSDDMGYSAPFGASVLQPIYRVYRQLAMIEDAVIIYRIVRAPERRVFYVDTGNLPPQRVKQYLEQIKNEIRQKRSPTSAGGKDTVDGAYDPTSIQEDLFFPVTSSGRGSRVETLPGGTEDFGTNLLAYFQNKVFRGLRIPTSYMGTGAEGQAGAATNDGKVGIAYIEELRFANFVMRLQDRIEEIIDQEFKVYLKVVGLKIDDEIFKIKLPDPANFALYRQAALDADLIGSFNNIEGTKYLSRRFILKRYLGLTDDEIQMNEVMLKEERMISGTSNISELQQIYDPAVYENREAQKVESSAAEAEIGGDPGSEEDFSAGSELPAPGDFFSAAPEEPAEEPATGARVEPPPAV